MPSALTLLSSPAQASPVLMRMFLQAVPDDEAGNPAAWSATVTQLEATLQTSLDRAVSAVEQWRNVPQVVVDAARETRSMVMSQLNDEPAGASLAASRMDVAHPAHGTVPPPPPVRTPRIDGSGLVVVG